MYLRDELCVQILCRLSCKVATQCKCICKKWATLISDHSLNKQFMASKDEDQSFAIITRIHHSCLHHDTWKGVIMYLKDPVFNFKEFSFEPLPKLVDAHVNPTDLLVVGACNDLLLYCRKKLKDRYGYYLCNIQTRQWVELPSLFYQGKYFIGFICDLSEGGYRFSIVVIPYTGKKASKLSPHLFSSKTSQWMKIVLSLPKRCRLKSKHGFVFDGMLHFRCMDGIIAFDSYSDVTNGNGTINCHIIPMPPGFTDGHECVGVREGYLQMFEFDDTQKLYVWVLKDYKKGLLSLQHSIELQEFLISDPCLVRFIEYGLFPALGFAMGQHPINPDIIYVLRHEWVVLCNAEKRTLEVASRVPADTLYYPYSIHFQVLLPIWPTPLPTLISLLYLETGPSFRKFCSCKRICFDN